MEDARRIYITKGIYRNLVFRYFQVPWNIVKDTSLKLSEKEVLTMMLHASERQYEERPLPERRNLVKLKASKLAKFLGCEVKTVRRAWGELERDGLINRLSNKYDKTAYFSIYKKVIDNHGIRIPVFWYDSGISFSGKLTAGAILSYLGLDRLNKDDEHILTLKLTSHAELGKRISLDRKTIIKALKEEVPRVLNVEMETINRRLSDGRFLSNNYFRIFIDGNKTIFPGYTTVTAKGA